MTASIDVILVDDDANVLDACRELLEIEGFRVSAHGSVAAALAELAADSEAVVVSDVRMPRQDGFDLVAAVQAIDRDIPIVLMTGHGDIPMALRAMRDGVWDFLEKPADPVHLIETVRRARDHRRLLLENRRLRLSIAADGWEARLIGHSAPMVALRERLKRIAGAATDILVLGETGTGKEVTARALHDFSGRKGRFVAVNCGAIPETMLESELFGHEAGAFTGAKDKRIGKIEHAHGGTLFLDEIESMPLPAQVRLLRVLQERVIERLGSNDEVAVDLQVVAATKADLHQLARQGRFREDLAYRLDIARVELPALSVRRGRRAALPSLPRFGCPPAGPRRPACPCVSPCRSRPAQMARQCARTAQRCRTLRARPRRSADRRRSGRGDAGGAYGPGGAGDPHRQSCRAGRPHRRDGGHARHLAQDAVPEDAQTWPGG